MCYSSVYLICLFAPCMYSSWFTWRVTRIVYTTLRVVYTSRVAYTTPRVAYTTPRVAYTTPRVAYTTPRVAYTTSRVVYTASRDCFHLVNNAGMQILHRVAVVSLHKCLAVWVSYSVLV